MPDRADHLQSALDKLNGSVAALATGIDGRFNSLAKLIEDQSASLQREMHARFNSLEAATARNTKIMAGGSKTITALAEWAEKRDALDQQRDQEIRELRARLEALEKKAS